MKRYWNTALRLAFFLLLSLSLAAFGGELQGGEAADLGGIRRHSQQVPDRYIVVFKDPVVSKSATAVAASELASDHGASIHHLYRHALRGFAATMPEDAALALSKDPRVAFVEEDAKVSIAATQVNPPWGLDRIDQRDLPLDVSYNYQLNGAGVTAYILDTGIRISHSEFGGRASSGFTSINDGIGTNDCNSHGTHVAGTVGGTTYGVAKGVKLVAVRVLNCFGSGTVSGVIAGIDWVTANHVKPAVANMSLGGGASDALDAAVTNSVAAGITYSVAAGNDAADACTHSPARTGAALTAGASNQTDSRASFSNWGRCLDLFAPGVEVLSASHQSDTASAVKSGTSMSAPHVAGVAALYLQANPTAAPNEVATALTNFASVGKIMNAVATSPNLLAYMGSFGCTGCDLTPPSTTITSPADGASVSGSVTVTAAVSDNVGVLRVDFLVDGMLRGTDAAAPYEFAWDTLEESNGSHRITARALDTSFNGGTSAPVQVTTTNPASASYDPALQAPKCGNVLASCDTGSLIVGRGTLVGPEANQPNTIRNSCADGPEGFIGLSLDRIRVSTLDGSELASGKTARVSATVAASSFYLNERLDLYYAVSANQPVWTYLTTFAPTQPGSQTFTTTYILPSGNLQAIRGNFRFIAPETEDIPSTCSNSGVGYDDRDDLAFAVSGTAMTTEPPTVTISSPLEGAVVKGIVPVNIAAFDDHGIAGVSLSYIDNQSRAIFIGSDTSAPYVINWDTTPAVSVRALRADASDIDGLKSSHEISITVDNTLPTTAITSPKSGVRIRGITTLAAIATDNHAVARVEFYVDGNRVGTDATAPYAVSWDSRRILNGAHVLVSRAYDVAGNIGLSSPISFTVRN